ncbi:hypothetical protein Esti_006131 [Eimeria stiedai]
MLMWKRANRCLCSRKLLTQLDNSSPQHWRLRGASLNLHKQLLFLKQQTFLKQFLYKRNQHKLLGSLKTLIKLKTLWCLRQQSQLPLTPLGFSVRLKHGRYTGLQLTPQLASLQLIPKAMTCSYTSLLGFFGWQQLPLTSLTQSTGSNFSLTSKLKPHVGPHCQRTDGMNCSGPTVKILPQNFTRFQRLKFVYERRQLYRLVQVLQAYCERARLRLYTTRDQEFPVPPMKYWGFCYIQALRSTTAFAVDCHRSTLDPKKSDYLTRVIDLAAEAEKRTPPPSLREDWRRPKSLSCPALPGQQPHAEQSGGVVKDITPRNSPRYTRLQSLPVDSAARRDTHTPSAKASAL